MNIKLPKYLIDFVFEESGDRSPQAYIINLLKKEHSTKKHTKEPIDEQPRKEFYDSERSVV